MKRSTTAVIVGVLALGLVGGGTAMALSNSGEPSPETSASTPAPDGSDAPVEASTDAPVTPTEAEAMPAYITEPGEVCDPENANDSLCAAFYPDQLVLNMTSPERSREPLSSMSDADKIALAHQACDNLPSQPHLVDTVMRATDHETTADRNNTNIYAAGALAYCNDSARGMEQYPDRIFKLIEFYRGLGEEGAKADFADKIMPTDEEIG